MCGASITTSNFKTGLTLEIDGAPWRVLGKNVDCCECKLQLSPLGGGVQIIFCGRRGHCRGCVTQIWI